MLFVRKGTASRSSAKHLVSISTIIEVFHQNKNFQQLGYQELGEKTLQMQEIKRKRKSDFFEGVKEV